MLWTKSWNYFLLGTSNFDFPHSIPFALFHLFPGPSIVRIFIIYHELSMFKLNDRTKNEVNTGRELLRLTLTSTVCERKPYLIGHSSESLDILLQMQAIDLSTQCQKKWGPQLIIRVKLKSSISCVSKITRRFRYWTLCYESRKRTCLLNFRRRWLCLREWITEFISHLL